MGILYKELSAKQSEQKNAEAAWAEVEKQKKLCQEAQDEAAGHKAQYDTARTVAQKHAELCEEARAESRRVTDELATVKAELAKLQIDHECLKGRAARADIQIKKLEEDHINDKKRLTDTLAYWEEKNKNDVATAKLAGFEEGKTEASAVAFSPNVAQRTAIVRDFFASETWAFMALRRSSKDMKRGYRRMYYHAAASYPDLSDISQFDMRIATPRREEDAPAAEESDVVPRGGLYPTTDVYVSLIGDRLLWLGDLMDPDELAELTGSGDSSDDELDVEDSVEGADIGDAHTSSAAVPLTATAALVSSMAPAAIPLIAAAVPSVSLVDPSTVDPAAAASGDELSTVGLSDSDLMKTLDATSTRVGTKVLADAGYRLKDGYAGFDADEVTVLEKQDEERRAELSRVPVGGGIIGDLDFDLGSSGKGDH